ncbi:MAG TPA: Fe-S cluster assembly protein SufD [Bacteroidales bacterium]|nr:Fe-S cluster assembly protein SufD [Bacteroidales bacterium]HPT03123.1 Fe-S cluster assembly protein SufD [Bacteroidales bacterium]
MDTSIQTYNLKERLIEQSLSRNIRFPGGDTPYVAGVRHKALEQFREIGLPHPNLERWRGTDLSKAFETDYHLSFDPAGKGVDIEALFKCTVPHFETFLVAQLNGWFVYNDGPLHTLPNGMVVGSLASAIHAHPGLIEKYYGNLTAQSDEGLTALNTAYALDGMIIYVPDNVSVEETLQMVNLIDSPENLMLHPRNLVILGKNAHLRLVQCDDSINHGTTFINAVTEVFMDEDSSLDHYKLQNKDSHSTLINTMYFEQQQGSRLTSNAMSLNGGIIRNSSCVKLDGENASADIYGLYLMDRNQHIDNRVFVDHAKPRCHSNELFKGVLDDHATGVFNGHVLVRRDAQQTMAYQKNNNILLTDKATIDTRPFLEIYADDVKCSHGATVGQLDANAMFYIRSRGISEASARILLMYAFAAEIINKISIPELKQRIDDMVKKRLRGELSICDQCVLQCSSQEKKADFKIDMSKI